jgi:hypothetical protein
VSGLEPVAAALDDALAGAGPAPIALTAVVRRWPAAVGELIAREAWPVRLQANGVLLVHCRASVWASELRHLEPCLRAALEEHGVMPAPPLRFAVGVVPRRPTPRPPADPDLPLDAASERLVSQWAGKVTDARLRVAVARAARASLRARESSSEEPSKAGSVRVNC